MFFCDQNVQTFAPGDGFNSTNWKPFTFDLKFSIEQVIIMALFFSFWKSSIGFWVHGPGWQKLTKKKFWRHSGLRFRPKLNTCWSLVWFLQKIRSLFPGTERRKFDYWPRMVTDIFLLFWNSPFLKIPNFFLAICPKKTKLNQVEKFQN